MYFICDDMDAAKKEAITNCPKNIILEVLIPDEISCEREQDVSDYLEKRYHFYIDVDENSDMYEQIFYNDDIRSVMGFVLNWCPLVLYLHPQYYASNLDDPNDYWTKRWKLLIEDSLIVEEY